jgi:hypothetical protein
VIKLREGTYRKGKVVLWDPGIMDSKVHILGRDLYNRNRWAD